MIRLGYAYVNTQLPAPNRTCRLSHAAPERIIALARENLKEKSVLEVYQILPICPIRVH